MPDIFISYAREDRERIVPLATAFEAQGWSVWWDRRMRTGGNINEVIAEQLAAAHCVVVAWSKNASGSHWVIDEAQEARDRGILLPIILERVVPPFGFRQFHVADLSDWRGQNSHAEFERLVLDIRTLLASRVSTTTSEQGNQQHDGSRPHPGDRLKPEHSTELVEFKIAKWFYHSFATAIMCSLYLGVCYLVFQSTKSISLLLLPTLALMAIAMVPFIMDMPKYAQKYGHLKLFHVPLIHDTIFSTIAAIIAGIGAMSIGLPAGAALLIAVGMGISTSLSTWSERTALYRQLKAKQCP